MTVQLHRCASAMPWSASRTELPAPSCVPSVNALTCGRELLLLCMMVLGVRGAALQAFKKSSMKPCKNPACSLLEIQHAAFFALPLPGQARAQGCQFDGLLRPPSPLSKQEPEPEASSGSWPERDRQRERALTPQFSVGGLREPPPSPTASSSPPAAASPVGGAPGDVPRPSRLAVVSSAPPDEVTGAAEAGPKAGLAMATEGSGAEADLAVAAEGLEQAAEAVKAEAAKGLQAEASEGSETLLKAVGSGAAGMPRGLAEGAASGGGEGTGPSTLERIDTVGSRTGETAGPAAVLQRLETGTSMGGSEPGEVEVSWLGAPKCSQYQIASIFVPVTGRPLYLYLRQAKGYLAGAAGGLFGQRRSALAGAAWLALHGLPPTLPQPQDVPIPITITPLGRARHVLQARLLLRRTLACRQAA